MLNVFGLKQVTAVNHTFLFPPSLFEEDNMVLYLETFLLPPIVCTYNYTIWRHCRGYGTDQILTIE